MTRKIPLIAAFTLIVALAVVLSSLSGAPTQAQNKREIEGATVEGNKVTLKSGYEFGRRASNQLTVKKKNVETKLPPPTVTCSCESTKAGCDAGNCKIKYTDTSATCVTGECCTKCKFN